MWTVMVVDGDGCGCMWTEQDMWPGRHNKKAGHIFFIHDLHFLNLNYSFAIPAYLNTAKGSSLLLSPYWPYIIQRKNYCFPRHMIGQSNYLAEDFLDLTIRKITAARTTTPPMM